MTLLERRVCLTCLDVVPPGEGILVHEKYLVCKPECFLDLHCCWEKYEEETGKDYSAFLRAVATVRSRGSATIYQQHLNDERVRA